MGDTVYFWVDPSSYEYLKPTSVSARRYMDLLLSWAETYLNVCSNYPSSVPAGAVKVSMKAFCRRFFRVYVHLFCRHSEDIFFIQKHLQYSLLHFILFMREFGLLVSAKEAEPLSDIITSFGIPHLSFAHD